MKQHTVTFVSFLFTLALLVAAFSLETLGLWPEFNYEAWDKVATLFWSLVPFLLCLILAISARLLYNLGPAVLAAWPTLKAELETRSAMNDALMWQARHAAKAQRKGM